MDTAEAPERLALEYGLADGIAVVQVTGEVDVASCGVLRDSLLRIVTDEGGCSTLKWPRCSPLTWPHQGWSQWLV